MMTKSLYPKLALAAIALGLLSPQPAFKRARNGRCTIPIGLSHRRYPRNTLMWPNCEHCSPVMRSTSSTADRSMNRALALLGLGDFAAGRRRA